MIPQNVNITISKDHGPCRLSYSQERLWFLDQFEPDSPLYNIPDARLIEGNLDIGAIKKSLDTILARHDVLRTTYQRGVEHPVQIVHQELDFEWAEHDLSSRDSIDCAIELEVLLREKILQPFDLTSGPMLRAMVVCLGEQKHILLLVIHHIASDGWSMGLLHSELSELYNAFSQGNHPELADLPIQYADFALWQRLPGCQQHHERSYGLTLRIFLDGCVKLRAEFEQLHITAIGQQSRTWTISRQ